MGQPDRVYSEQEVAELMKRAVALQEGSKESTNAYRPGVTREELVRAAEEMGVEPRFLEQAISEKLLGNTPRGHPVFQEEQRVVEGELDPADFDIILGAIRTASSRRHPVTQVGRTLSARAMTGSGIARLEVTSRNGRTRINVKPFPVLEVIGTFYPAFLVSMIAGGQLSHAAPGVATAVAAGAFAAAALVCRAWLSRSRTAASRLADRLQGVISEHVAIDTRARLAAAREPVEQQATEQAQRNP